MNLTELDKNEEADKSPQQKRGRTISRNNWRRTGNRITVDRLLMLDNYDKGGILAPIVEVSNEMTMIMTTDESRVITGHQTTSSKLTSKHNFRSNEEEEKEINNYQSPDNMLQEVHEDRNESRPTLTMT